MRNYANRGYVVLANKLSPLFSTDVEKANEWNRLVTEFDGEDGLEPLQEFLDNNTPAGTVIPELFVLSDEDESIDLERGVVYAEYDAADLFEMIPTKFAERLRAVGIIPESNAWVTFG